MLSKSTGIGILCFFLFLFLFFFLSTQNQWLCLSALKTPMPTDGLSLGSSPMTVLYGTLTSTKASSFNTLSRDQDTLFMPHCLGVSGQSHFGQAQLCWSLC